jgi:hypothetical protein
MSRQSIFRRFARRGNAAMEFGLWFMPVVVTVACIVDASLYISSLHTVSRISRDAARVGSTVLEPFCGPPSSCSVPGTLIEARTKDYAGDALALAGMPTASVATDWVGLPAGAPVCDQYWFIKVDIGQPYSPLFGNLQPWFQGPVTAQFLMLTQEQPEKTGCP